MSDVQLPNELLALIFPQCSSDRLSLANLCLVSKTFCSLSQPLLFHEVVLSNSYKDELNPERSNASQFSRTIFQSPHLGPCVQALHLHSLALQTTKTLSSAIPYLTNVQTLILNGDNVDSRDFGWDHIQIDLRHALQTHIFPRINHLSFRTMNSIQMGLLWSCPQLRELDFLGGRIDRFSVPDGNSSPAPLRLTSLSFRDTKADSWAYRNTLFNVLDLEESEVRLTSLALTCSCLSYTSMLPNLTGQFQKQVKTIETLCLDSSLTYGLADVVPRFENLRKLHFHVHAAFKSAAFIASIDSFFYAVSLSLVDAPTLREICFYFPWSSHARQAVLYAEERHSKGTGWSVFDAAVTSLPNVHMVVFDFSAALDEAVFLGEHEMRNEYITMVCEQLKRCCKLKLLRFVTSD